MSLKTLSPTMMYPYTSKIFHTYLQFLDVNQEHLLLEFIKEMKTFKNVKCIKPFLIDHFREVAVDVDVIVAFAEEITELLMESVVIDKII